MLSSVIYFEHNHSIVRFITIVKAIVISNIIQYNTMQYDTMQYDTMHKILLLTTFVHMLTLLYPLIPTCLLLLISYRLLLIAYKVITNPYLHIRYHLIRRNLPNQYIRFPFYGILHIMRYLYYDRRYLLNFKL